MALSEQEARLLSSISTPADLIYCQREGITRQSFRSTDSQTDSVKHGDVFEYMEKYAKENHGDLPVVDDLIVLHAFTPGEPGDLRTYVRLIRESEIAGVATDTMVRAIESMRSNPAEMLREVTKSLAELQMRPGRRLAYLDKDAMERLETFDEAARNFTGEDTTFVPTGLLVLDKERRYFRPGELVVVFGPTGVGKSWLLMHMATVAYLANKKILLLSPELTKDEQGKRFDVMYSFKTKGPLLHNEAIVIGSENRDVYARFLGGLTGRSDFACIDSTDAREQRGLSFDDAWRFASEFKPDVLIIDGIHLMSSGNQADDRRPVWEKVLLGSGVFKSLAQQEKIVVIAAAQANADAMKSSTKPGRTHQVAGGVALPQAADFLISLFWPREHSDKIDHEKSAFERVYSIQKTRTGKDRREQRFLVWNVDIGDIHESDRPVEKFGDPENF